MPDDKPKYQNVGMVYSKEGKFGLVINTPVVLHDDGHVIKFFNLYEPKPKEKTTQQAAPPTPDFDDDLPF